MLDYIMGAHIYSETLNSTRIREFYEKIDCSDNTKTYCWYISSSLVGDGFKDKRVDSKQVLKENGFMVMEMICQDSIYGKSSFYRVIPPKDWNIQRLKEDKYIISNTENRGLFVQEYRGFIFSSQGILKQI